MTPEREMRLRLLANGYEPLPLAGRDCLLAGWSKAAITPDMAESWEHVPQWSNTGLRCGRLAVADIDIIDAARAKAVEAAVTRELGPSPLRRVGSKGVALLYRNESPIRKINVSGKLPGADKPERVEFLGAGQQLAAFGLHPSTGRAYQWPLECIGGDPTQTRIADLPDITPDKIRAAANAAAESMRQLGYEDVKITGDTGEREQGNEAPVDSPPVRAAMIEDMLRHVDPGCDRRTWIKVAGALRSARVIEDDCDLAELFARWSRGALHGMAEPPTNYKSDDDCAKNFESLDQAAEEMQVAREPVQLCDDESRPVAAAGGERSGELRAIGALPGLSLAELSDDSTILRRDERANGCLLGLQA